MREYLNIKLAAIYCGYSASYFPNVILDYSIPRYGPKRNRLKISDLNMWMHNPNIFKNNCEETRRFIHKVR